jgi:UDP-N-acetylglucosamine--N-acetylmuramyl-(pentapeptide) pyrophosphoryl-undecaprenol N-acetylglucosamine transferase
VRLILAGGGTTGHVGPLLATAAELQRRDPSVELRVVGTAEGIETRLVPAAGLELVTIPKVPFPRRPDGAALRFPARFRAAKAQVSALLAEFRPAGVVGFGGYASPPVYLAAAKAGVPVVVHEANAKPGLANRLGARRAAAVGVTFPQTQLPRAELTGMPLRRAIADLDRPTQRAAARAELGLAADRPTLLVSGGSLGAQRLNQAVAAVAADLLAAGAQVLHLTGRGKAEPVAAALTGLADAQHYHVVEYLDRMELAFAAADLAVQRAGAGTVSELACVGLPSVLVPLPIGNGEQRLNAAGLVAAGGAELVDDAAFPAWASANLVDLLSDGARLAAMAAGAEKVAIRDGAERLCGLIERVAVVA